MPASCLSERRLTRSQARATGASQQTSTPANKLHAAITSTPGRDDNLDISFCKSGRKVLGDLACNDSPVIGLLPSSAARFKKSHDMKMTPLGSCEKPSSRRELSENSDQTDTVSSTPLGETLLRSQVQRLLQRVECEKTNASASPFAKAPSLRTLCHLNGLILNSPSLLHSGVAPTPLNTPASPAGLCVQPPTPVMSVSSSMYSIQTVVPSSEHEPTQIRISESVLSGGDNRVLQFTPLQTERDFFYGKRALQFDTPDKNTPASPDEHPHVDNGNGRLSIRISVGSPSNKSLDSQLERVSFSCYNPSSDSKPRRTRLSTPFRKATPEGSDSEEDNVESTPLETKFRTRRSSRPPTPFIKLSPQDVEDEEDGDENSEVVDNEDEENVDHNSDFEEHAQYDNDDDECYEDEETDSLCDQLQGMNFSEKQGLPMGQGKHIRFLYTENSDGVIETVEECVTNNTDAHLNGLPAPCGRHSRFYDEDDEEI